MSAEYGVNAFSVANCVKHEWIVPDITMPNTISDQLVKEETISIKADIPVIICTGFSERLDEGKTGSIGIKGFLMKPIIMKRSEISLC